MSDARKIFVILFSIAAQTLLTAFVLIVMPFGVFGNMNTSPSDSAGHSSLDRDGGVQAGSAASLRVSVGTLGQEPARETGINTARYHNQGFHSVRASKDVDRGLLHIRYQWSQQGLPPTGQFLVRLFDRNGVNLTYFVSEPIHEMYSHAEWTNPGIGAQDVSFQVAARDLREAESMEFGWAPFDVRF